MELALKYRLRRTRSGLLRWPVLLGFYSAAGRCAGRLRDVGKQEAQSNI